MSLTDLKKKKSSCSLTTENGQMRVCFLSLFVVMMREVAIVCTPGIRFPRGKAAVTFLHQQKKQSTEACHYGA